MIKVICGECRKLLGWIRGEAGRESHGLCGRCRDRLQAEIENRKVK